MKRLVLSIIKANGKINHYDDQNIEVTINLEGKFTRLPLRHSPFSDIGILNEFVVLNEYDELFALTQHAFHKGERINIIDAGSNIGLFTVFMKAHFPNSKIIMIEPDHEGIAQFNKISRGLALDGYEVLQNGLLDQSGIEINISLGFRGTGNAGFVVSKSIQKSTLTSININDIIARAQFDTIHILKLDIEGSEEDVILGKNFDENLAQKIRYIAIEIHDDIVNRSLIEEKLSRLNFIKMASGRVDIFKNQHDIGTKIS